jgi:hypothetical protein
MSPRKQGDLGELSAIDWLGAQGYALYLPLGHSPDVDLIALDGERTLKVQVKTSTVYRGERWEVTLCTRGGNRSWNGLVKYFSAALRPPFRARRRWTPLVHPLGGGVSRLGIAPGWPEVCGLRDRTRTPPALGSGPLTAILHTLRRGSRAVKGVAL